MGSQSEDFFLIQEILDRSRSALPAELDHASSLEEAKTMLGRTDYGKPLVPGGVYRNILQKPFT